MLLGSIDLLFQDPAAFFRYIPLLMALVGFALIVGITVHEFSHAFLAYRMGDWTGKRLGRLTLNPKAHLDPLGTLLLFVVGFGWGKPVPVNVHALNQGRRAMALVAAAGPLSNVVIAFLIAIPFKLGVLDWQSPGVLDISSVGSSEMFSTVLIFIIYLNLLLAVFNLLPFFPLDGSKILMGLLPESMSESMERLERFGPILLLIVIILDYMTGMGILWGFLGPIVNYLISVATGT